MYKSRGIFNLRQCYAFELAIVTSVCSLKEIVVAAAGGSWHTALVVGHCGENGESGLDILSEIHDGGNIATAVTVVRGTPYGDDGFVLKVPLLCAVSASQKLEEDHDQPCSLH